MFCAAHTNNGSSIWNALLTNGRRRTTVAAVRNKIGVRLWSLVLSCRGRPASSKHSRRTFIVGMILALRELTSPPARESSPDEEVLV